MKNTLSYAKNRITLYSWLAWVGILLWSVLAMPLPVAAQSDIACQGIAAAGGDCGSGEAEVTSTLQNGINILLFVVGVAAIISIVIGAFRFVLSGGDQSAIANARKTVIYSIIGLIVALLAYAIVNFVFNSASA